MTYSEYYHNSIVISMFLYVSLFVCPLAYLNSELSYSRETRATLCVS